jgi:hypothetical protein
METVTFPRPPFPETLPTSALMAADRLYDEYVDELRREGLIT